MVQRYKVTLYQHGKPNCLQRGSAREYMVYAAQRYNAAELAEEEFARSPYGRQGKHIDWKWLERNDYIAPQR